MSTIRAYLAGPMGGIKGYNHKAFHRYAKAIREQEKDVALISPAENFGGVTHFDREEYIRTDLNLLLTCSVVYLMPGWYGSRGACLEALAAQECGMLLIEVTEEDGEVVFAQMRRDLMVVYIPGEDQ